MHDSGRQVSNLDKEKKKDIEQALQDKGFEPGSVDGVIDSQTLSAISQFQRPTTCLPPNIGRKNGSAEMGVEIMPSKSERQRLERSGTESSVDAEGTTSSSSSSRAQ